MWEDIVGINIFWMNIKISFLYVITTKNLLVVFLFRRMKFWSLIHQSTFTYLGLHVINGQPTLRISTVPEAQNHPIIGLLFSPFFSSVLNKCPIWLEQTKRKVKRASLEWDYFLLQEHLKALMYVDSSLRGDPRKDRLID